MIDPKLTAKKTISRLTAIIAGRDTAAWDETALWHEIKEKQWYRYAPPPHNTSFTAFIRGAGELSQTVIPKVRNYEMWVVAWKVPVEKLIGVNSHKLYVGIPAVRRGHSPLAVLTKARELKYDDFITWVRKGK